MKGIFLIIEERWLQIWTEKWLHFKIRLRRQFIFFIPKVIFKKAQIIFLKCIKIAVGYFNFGLAIIVNFYMVLIF